MILFCGDILIDELNCFHSKYGGVGNVATQYAALNGELGGEHVPNDNKYTHVLILPREAVNTLDKDLQFDEMHPYYLNADYLNMYEERCFISYRSYIQEDKKKKDFYPKYLEEERLVKYFSQYFLYHLSRFKDKFLVVESHYEDTFLVESILKAASRFKNIEHILLDVRHLTESLIDVIDLALCKLPETTFILRLNESTYENSKDLLVTRALFAKLLVTKKDSFILDETEYKYTGQITEEISTVGCGDSFVAGLVHAIANYKLPILEAAKYGFLIGQLKASVEQTKPVRGDCSLFVLNNIEKFTEN